MKYSELSDKERYEIIKLGVQNGMTNLDDIEKAYNEYAKGGYVNDEYYNNTLLRKDEQQKQNIKEQLEKRKTYSLGGNISHKFGDGSNIYGYSENDDALTLYKDIDDIYVTPNGNYYQGEEFNERKQQDIVDDINNNPALLFRPEYSKWYNYYRTEAKKQGWDFDETMSTMFNRLPFESQEWIVQNNPGAFRLLPQNIQSDYITRTKGMRPGALQRLVNDAGENFLGKSVNNAVTAASLISLPNITKVGAGVDALGATKFAKGFNQIMKKPVETYFGFEAARSGKQNIDNFFEDIKKKDYVNAAGDIAMTAFDWPFVRLGGNAVRKGIKNMKNVGNASHKYQDGGNNRYTSKIHVYKTGESTRDIANMYGVNENDIELVNPSWIDGFKEGQQIIIPDKHDLEIAKTKDYGWDNEDDRGKFNKGYLSKNVSATLGFDPFSFVINGISFLTNGGAGEKKNGETEKNQAWFNRHLGYNRNFEEMPLSTVKFTGDYNEDGTLKFPNAEYVGLPQNLKNVVRYAIRDGKINPKSDWNNATENGGLVNPLGSFSIRENNNSGIYDIFDTYNFDRGVQKIIPDRNKGYEIEVRDTIHGYNAKPELYNISYSGRK